MKALQGIREIPQLSLKRWRFSLLWGVLRGLQPRLTRPRARPLGVNPATPLHAVQLQGRFVFSHRLGLEEATKVALLVD